MPRRVLALVVLLCTLLASSIAAAQTDQDKQLAQKHFELGRQMREKGDCRGAIAEFNEVLKHGESVGAYLNLGQCYDTLGAYRRAIEAFDKAILTARSTSDERSADANLGAKQIRASHPWIMLVVKSEVVDLDGLQIFVDDQIVPKEEYNGEVFRARAGRHAIQISAKDRDTAIVNANDRERVEVRLDMLKSRGDHVPPPPAPGGSGGTGWPWQKWVGAGLVVGSLVPLVLSVAWTASYFSTRSDLENRYVQPFTDSNGQKNKCSGRHAPDKTKGLAAEGTECLEIENDYLSNEDRAKGRLVPGYVIGGVMLIGGAVLFALAPSKTEQSANVRFIPTLGGGMLFGTF